ncbi:MAG: SRPBCC domain-containing protein, partial [Thermomicrobiales bacterium]
MATDIEREIQIMARPETVFAYLTDPAKLVAWMGKQATLDARPGGAFRLRYDEGHVASGEYVEVVPNERVVLTWGWEAEGAATPPGASSVEITLTPDGDGTRLRLVHRGLSDDEARSHSEGWDLFLPKLVEV